MSVQRYSINWVWQEEETDYEGEWVKYENCKTLESELQAAKDRIKALEDGIREHWQESTHGLTANMPLADEKLHRLI